MTNPSPKPLKLEVETESSGRTRGRAFFSTKEVLTFLADPANTKLSIRNERGEEIHSVDARFIREELTLYDAPIPS